MQNKNVNYRSRILMYLLMPTILVGCGKFVDIQTPPNKISTESAFRNDLTAAAVLTGLYSQMMVEFSNPEINIYGASFYSELSSDNLALIDPENGDGTIREFYLHSIPSNSVNFWQRPYASIYAINIALKELEFTTQLTPSVKKRLQGEALFLRAFYYFYLVNLFGDVPLAIQSDHVVNKVLPRSPINKVYEQITTDLNNAEKLLTLEYLGADAQSTSNERLRPNVSAVNAMQARVYLYRKMYSESETASSKVINQSNLYSLVEPDIAFHKNSQETIWSLQPVTIGENTKEAKVYLLTNPGVDLSTQVRLSDELMSSFEIGDERRSAWIDSISVETGRKMKVYRFSSKYKQGLMPGSTTINEYAIVLRLSELYLIRAEARNELGNITGAVEDLNLLRSKRRAMATVDIPNPLPPLSNSLTKESLRLKILLERQTELFTEWGHRWLDLKRTNMINEVMTPVGQKRGVTWENYKALYPIPVGDILLNKNLTQNPGYLK